MNKDFKISKKEKVHSELVVSFTKVSDVCAVEAVGSCCRMLSSLKASNCCLSVASKEYLQLLEATRYPTLIWSYISDYIYVISLENAFYMCN